MESRTSAADGGALDELLGRVRQGEADAAEELFCRLYEEIHRTASILMAREPAGHTLQPTALVNEVFVRIFGNGATAVRDDEHLLALSATVMRRVLTDAARARLTDKRTPPEVSSSAESMLRAFDRQPVDVVALDDALQTLAARDERLVRIVELRFYAGLTAEEVARVLHIGERTVYREWEIARAWLRDRLA